MEASIFLPTFKEYAKTFFNIIKDETKIKADFKAFKNTAIFERYMLNAYQFSAAKSVAVNGMMKSTLFDDKGVRKGYSAFKRDASAITDIVNDIWLRTEYDTSIRLAVAGDQFRQYKEDSDIYPYWVYLETTSAHPREDHLTLVGNIYKIGSPESDAVFPPGGWNCSCGSEQIDDQYLDEKGLIARTEEQASEDLKEIDPQFRFNASTQGILPKEGHSYFQALSSANDADGNTFGITGTSAPPTKLSAVGLHQFSELVHEWKIKYHTDGLHEIIFQNEKLLTNIIFNNKSFSNIAHHAKGTDQLADTVIDCDECWSYWANAEKQTEVFRNYIKGNFAVTTKDGYIIDAHLVDNVNRFRKGVIVY